jgi:hypothetical protein
VVILRLIPVYNKENILLERHEKELIYYELGVLDKSIFGVV